MFKAQKRTCYPCTAYVNREKPAKYNIKAYAMSDKKILTVQGPTAWFDRTLPFRLNRAVSTLAAKGKWQR